VWLETLLAYRTLEVKRALSRERQSGSLREPGRSLHHRDCPLTAQQRKDVSSHLPQFPVDHFTPTSAADERAALTISARDAHDIDQSSHLARETAVVFIAKLHKHYQFEPPRGTHAQESSRRPRARTNRGRNVPGASHSNYNSGCPRPAANSASPADP